MNSIKIKALLFFGMIIFLMPFSAFAALVSCGRSEENMCTLCDIILGIYEVVKWGIGIMVVVAIFSITVAGILYIVSMGNPGMMGMAKNAIKYALVGVVVMLGAVIIVNTIMTLLATKADLGIGVSHSSEMKAWRTFNCSSQ